MAHEYNLLRLTDFALYFWDLIDQCQVALKFVLTFIASKIKEALRHYKQVFGFSPTANFHSLVDAFQPGELNTNHVQSFMFLW